MSEDAHLFPCLIEAEPEAVHEPFKPSLELCMPLFLRIQRHRVGIHSPENFADLP